MPWRAHHSSPRFMMARSCACSCGVGLGSGSPPVASPSRARLPPARLEQRPERLAFAQFAFRQPVGAHHDLVARPERLAVQQPGELQRFRVRPHRMMIRRRHGERPVGDDAVEMMARHALGGRQDRVVGALRLQQLRLGPLRGIGANRLRPAHRSRTRRTTADARVRRRRQTDAYALR